MPVILDRAGPMMVGVMKENNACQLSVKYGRCRVFADIFYLFRLNAVKLVRQATDDVNTNEL